MVADELRAESIAAGRPTSLRNRNEQQLAGYRKAVDYLWTQDWLPLNVGLILHVHRLLWSETDVAGGEFKQADNLAVDRHTDGTQTIRFRPVPALETEFYLNEVIHRYQQAQAAQRHHPILLVGLFVLDLLVIHPFDDGNGRVARALTNALLLDAGYTATRYVSLEQQIALSADEYYARLLASTHHWHEQQADPWPWLEYFVGLLVQVYQMFGRRAAADRGHGSKQDRVRDYIQRDAAAVFRVADIRRALPGISDQTIRLVLDGLRAADRIQAQGQGRSAAWRKLS